MFLPVRGSIRGSFFATALFIALFCLAPQFAFAQRLALWECVLDDPISLAIPRMPIRAVGNFADLERGPI